MRKELAKQYDPKIVEDRIYDFWIKENVFHADEHSEKEPFTIVIPPPNITGVLHMGHALDNTLQDILIRYKKMQGYETLWQPGTDHAAISTEVKIVQKLLSEGVTKADLGREGFMKRAWEWKEEYGGSIINQLKKLGASCDWERERFTMDEGLSDAVLEVFMKYYEEGYIYQGDRIINWCPTCKTTISEAEVEHVSNQGHFYHIKYPLKDSDAYLHLATTRPETLLGDTGIAVNPNDERYQHLIGKTAILPLVGRELPIVADDYVDMAFGTGVVKMTPGHDPNDFEVGKRTGLDTINVMHDDGTINENGGVYAGMDRYVCRKAIVADLEAQGFLEKIEPHAHNVGTHDRCDTVVEPLIKKQWFLKMEELAKPAIEALASGALKFVPERYGKTYMNWLENIRDWCISRQLWWGHRIPVYYCQSCPKRMVAKEMPDRCPDCGGTHFKQDEDSLDTWFSSALWPFSTLGWPKDNPTLDKFYPTDVLVTGYDIIFFWVIRMVFSGIKFTDQLPFHTVYIHGLVRDEQGRKMSKSLGNGIDPLELIDQYGADALRLTLVTGNGAGNDMRFAYDKVEASRNFGNKIWNASRFIMMHLPDEGVSQPDLKDLTDADRWILSKVNNLAVAITENMDHYDLGIAVAKCYDFIWESFCDWYIEMVKPRLYDETDASKPAAIWTLKTVLVRSMQLLHPFMPFITEEIYQTITGKVTSILEEPYPVDQVAWHFEREEKAISLIQAAVHQIRNLRANMQVSPKRKADVYVVSEEPQVRDIFEAGKIFFATLGYAKSIVIQEEKTGISDNAVSLVIPGATIYIPFEDLVDMAQERKRLEDEQKRLENEIKRVDQKLGNPGFVGKAPKQVIEEEIAKKEKYQQMLVQVLDRLQVF